MRFYVALPLTVTTTKPVFVDTVLCSRDGPVTCLSHSGSQFWCVAKWGKKCCHLYECKQERPWLCGVKKVLKICPCCKALALEWTLNCFSQKLYLCAITEGRVCVRACACACVCVCVWAGQKLWEIIFVCMKWTPLMSKEYLEAASQHCLCTYLLCFPLFLLWTVTTDLVFLTVWLNSLREGCLLWRRLIRCLHINALNKKSQWNKKNNFSAVRLETSDRKDWQSQTSLFLSFIQVTYCMMDYSTNFLLLCCLYSMWSSQTLVLRRSATLSFFYCLFCSFFCKLK